MKKKKIKVATKEINKDNVKAEMLDLVNKVNEVREYLLMNLKMKDFISFFDVVMAIASGQKECAVEGALKSMVEPIEKRVKNLKLIVKDDGGTYKISKEELKNQKEKLAKVNRDFEEEYKNPKYIA
jgi:hypothetical protein